MNFVKSVALFAVPSKMTLLALGLLAFVAVINPTTKQAHTCRTNIERLAGSVDMRQLKPMAAKKEYVVLPQRKPTPPDVIGLYIANM